VPAKRSAGLLMYRVRGGALQVLLAHPGGPYWSRRDDGAWALPKGEIEPDEDPLAAACREFQEETGVTPQGPFASLGELKQSGGKHVQAWAFEGDMHPDALVSNTFELEWPPRSGKLQSYPEVDRVAWFTVDEAAVKLLASQRPFLERLVSALQTPPSPRAS